MVGFWTLLALAVGLAMDATAVSAARGLAADRIEVRHVIVVAIAFGGFQALMPALGWALGAQLGPPFEAWGHWIAFGILAGIGGKMLWDSREHAEDTTHEHPDLFGTKVMLVLAIATSIDAFAAGISLPMLGLPLLASVVVIGVVTALSSTAGLFAGRHLGAISGKRLDAAGGLVLIGIGAKILLRHTVNTG